VERYFVTAFIVAASTEPITVASIASITMEFAASTKALIATSKEQKFTVL